MIFQKSILYTLLFATINLIFCVPQQNDLITQQNHTIYSSTEQAESEIQSVIELICEAVFDTDINLPLDEEAALLEKDFLGKRLNRNIFTFLCCLTLLNTKIESSRFDSVTNYINSNNNSETTSTGYSFIFRLTPF